MISAKKIGNNKKREDLDRTENDDLGAPLRFIEESFDLLSDTFLGQFLNDLSPPRLKRRYDHTRIPSSKFGNEDLAVVSCLVLGRNHDKRAESEHKIFIDRDSLRDQTLEIGVAH